MVQLFNISVKYGDYYGIKRINLEIDKGEFVYIFGPSGAGKSTLLRTLYLDLIPSEGHFIIDKYNSLYIKKKDIPFLRRKIGVVFQDFMLLEDRNIHDNIDVVFEIANTLRKERKRRMLKMFVEMGLSHKLKQMSSELSGGEKQKVGIARAIINDPLILLADEPTGNLDPETAIEIFDILKKINQSGTAVMVATHNHELPKTFPGRIVKMEKGEIVSTKY
ncbi:cell division ATP-binding protein FtsE [candidate division KSB1 bacterium]